ncbi:MAG TPA: hypothetical protein PLH94_09080 [Fimbriimonadaceae bacterium]|nr:hypothetical protein [Fimbriimonadaceae bacterium]
MIAAIVAVVLGTVALCVYLYIGDQNSRERKFELTFASYAQEYYGAHGTFPTRISDVRTFMGAEGDHFDETVRSSKPVLRLISSSNEEAKYSVTFNWFLRKRTRTFSVVIEDPPQSPVKSRP